MRIPVLFLLFPLLSFAANHYVRSGATGSGNGSDWTNACTDFTGSCAVASLVRGDTYYVATGTYGGRTFSTTASSTLVITIKGATVADHGTSTGWLNSYSVDASDGGTQATWSNEVDFTSSYWTFDGNSATALWDTITTNYGFKFADGLARGSTFGLAGSVGNNAPAITNITISHVTAHATSSDVEKEFIEGNSSSGAHSNCTVSHSLFNGWQGLVMTKGQSGTAYDSWTVTYNVMLNGYSSPANHGEWINPNERPISNWTIAYNVFKGHSGASGMTGTIVANNSDNNGSLIYGNVFDGLQVGNGVITGTSAGNLNNAVVYNNAFLNMTSDSGNAIGGTGQGTGNVARNNLFYNTSASQGGGFTFDYDAYFSTTNTPTETHGQVASGNPFVNSASSNYHLTAHTNAGTTLVSPYDIDPDGVSRSASGNWDRGAFEFAAGPSLTGSPSSLSFGNVTVGSTSAQQNFTVSNTGTTVLTISSVGFTGTNPGDFADTHTCGTLPATLGVGSSCTVHVTFTPGAAGARSATLQVVDTPDSLTATSSLSGTGVVPAPALQVSPSSLSFSSSGVGIPSGTQVFTVSNPGTLSATVSSIGFTGTNAGDFSQTNNCGTLPATLAAGGSCTVTVTFTATALGTRTATLTVTDTPDSLTASGAVSGVAGSTSFRSSSSTTYASRTNTTITAPAGIQSGDVVLLFFADGNTTPPTPTPPTGFSALTGFPKSVALGGFTVANYCWYKVAGSSEPTSYTVTHGSASTQAYAVAISGANTAVAPTATTNSGTGTTTTALSITTTAANSFVMFVSQDWGDTANPLSAPSGSTPTFTQRLSGTSGILTVSDGVLATAGATGNKTITSNSGSASPWSGYLVDVEAASSAPLLSISPSSLSFGSITVGSSSLSQDFTLSNTGTALATVSSITITGTNSGDFSQTNTCSVTLAAGANCAIHVRFTPTATGARSATVQETDASGQNPSGSVSGTGTAPPNTPTTISGSISMTGGVSLH